MILYKTIALKFAKYLEAEEPAIMVGLDGELVTPEDTRQHWKSILNDLASARIYLLDHNAANYLDSLRMDVQGMPWEDRPESEIQDYVRDVDFPRDIIWVEYDDRKLWEDRVERKLTELSDEEWKHRTQRGFLYDNRAPEVLTVRLFSALSETAFLDAPLVLELSKDNEGRPNFTNPRWHPNKSVLAGLLRAGLLKNPESAMEALKEHQGHLTYEMVIGFMLFAALAAREDDLVMQEGQSLTNAQIKTARKFGKAWITDVLKSHVTIRIGPAAERHLAEQKARRMFEEAQATGRASPTEHWVAEHERRYASGKVIRVRSHKRGADKGLPARIVGPRKQD